MARTRTESTTRMVEEQKTGTAADTASVQEGTRRKAPQESVYTADELAGNAVQLFGVMPECAIVALKMAGITSCTVSQAKELVRAFMKKEVK